MAAAEAFAQNRPVSYFLAGAEVTRLMFNAEGRMQNAEIRRDLVPGKLLLHS
jgi:YD repeat-containing protein